MELPPLRPWLPEGCRPRSLVRLDERSLGLRIECPSGERMTMPLRPASFRMLRHGWSFRSPRD